MGYLKVKLNAVYSENEDFTAPTLDLDDWAPYLAPTLSTLLMKDSTAPSGSTAIYLSGAAVAFCGFMAMYLGTSGYIVITYYSMGAAAYQNVRVPAGGLVWIPDADPAGVIQLDYTSGVGKKFRFAVFGA